MLCKNCKNIHPYWNYNSTTRKNIVGHKYNETKISVLKTHWNHLTQLNTYFSMYYMKKLTLSCYVFREVLVVIHDYLNFSNTCQFNFKKKKEKLFNAPRLLPPWHKCGTSDIQFRGLHNNHPEPFLCSWSRCQAWTQDYTLDKACGLETETFPTPPTDLNKKIQTWQKIKYNVGIICLENFIIVHNIFDWFWGFRSLWWKIRSGC